MKFFGRKYKLRVDRVEIEGETTRASTLGIDIAFQIDKSLKNEPNKARIQIFNLAEDTRNDLMKRHTTAKGARTSITCELEAGYAEETALVLKGDVMQVENVQTGRNTWVTSIAVKDGGHQYKTAHISKNFAKGTTVETVVRAIVEALGIGAGNLGNVASSLKMQGVGKTFARAYVVHGSAEEALTKIVRGCGYEWSIQSGALFIHERNKPAKTEVYELGPESGLIGSPRKEVDATVLGKDGKAKPAKSGGITAKTLIIPRLAPGDTVSFNSRDFKGQHFITEMGITGSTFGQEWYSDLKLRPVNG